MKWPLIRRSTHEAELREATRAEADAILQSRHYERRAAEAENALWAAFGVSVDEALNADVVEYRLHVSRAVLNSYRGDTRQLLISKLHEELDRIIASN